MVTLLGWQEALFEAWYIAVALLGDVPLAIGTIYLLFGRLAGHGRPVATGEPEQSSAVIVDEPPLDGTQTTEDGKDTK